MTGSLSELNSVNAFRTFWDLGYRQLHPILPPDARIRPSSRMDRFINGPNDPRGKAPGLLGFDGFWGGLDFQKHTTDPGDFETWTGWGAGVGLRMGGGLAALDCDTLDPFLAELVWREWQDAFPRAVGAWPRRYGNRPKFLILFRTPEGEAVPYRRVIFPGASGKPERVELLTAGRQIVVSGIHPKTRQPYLWEPPPEAREALPEISAAELAAFFQSLSNRIPGASEPVLEGAAASGTVPDQRSLTAPLEAVRKAVSALPNTSEHFPTRNSYLNVGYAIKAALPDNKAEALELYQQWAARWEGNLNAPEGNDPTEVEHDWGRMKGPFKIGAGWLFEQAETLSSGVFSRAADYWFSPIEDETADWLPVAAPAALRTYAFSTLGEAAAGALSQLSTPLVKGLIDQGAMSVLYGPSGSGKSFLALDIAAHVALGRSWAGMKTIQGGVVYVMAEGAQGARKRAAALLHKMGRELEAAPFHFLMSGVDLLRPDADLRPLTERLRQFTGLKLVVLDTLSRTLAGGDENSPVDMGALVKHFDALRLGVGCHLMAVHHTGKDVARGARGHSLLKAATDTELECLDGQLTAEKQKEIETNMRLSFALETLTLGMDDDGDPITSCVVRIGDRPAAPPEPPSATEKFILEAMAGEQLLPREIAERLADAGRNVSDSLLRAHLSKMKHKRLVNRDGAFWRQIVCEESAKQDVFE